MSLKKAKEEFVKQKKWFFICCFYFLPCSRSKSLTKAFHFGQWEWCLKYQTWWENRKGEEEGQGDLLVSPSGTSMIWKKSVIFFLLCHSFSCVVLEKRPMDTSPFVTWQKWESDIKMTLWQWKAWACLCRFSPLWERNTQEMNVGVSEN